jgi:hypothetical protein
MHISSVQEQGAHMAVTSLHLLLVDACDGNDKIDDSKLDIDEPIINEEGEREKDQFSI